ARLIIIAVLGLIIVGGIFLVMTSNQQGGVAPVSPNVVAEAPAPQRELSPSDQLIAVAPSTPATEDTVAPTTDETPAPQSEVSDVAPSQPAPVAEAAPEVAAPVEPAPVKATPVEAVKPASPTKAAVVPQAGGAYVVQLLALRDDASAR